MSERFIRPEYCGGPFYTGWHLYLRETNDGEPNAFGEWGWIRRGDDAAHLLDKALRAIGADHPHLTYPMNANLEIAEWSALVKWFVARYPLGLRVAVDEAPYPSEMRILPERPAA